MTLRRAAEAWRRLDARWTIPALAGAVGLLAASGSAAAQSYPRGRSPWWFRSRPAQRQPAARSVADKMGEILGQQIVIDNRGGAGGTVATRSVAKTAPDGYTLLVVTSATVGTSPSLIENLGYDPRKDFDPIGIIAATPNLIVVHPSFPARSLAELIKIGREAASPILYGSPGTGTPQSSHGRAARLPDRHEARARPLQGRRPRAQRSARRPYRRADQRDPQRPQPHRRRHHPRPGGDGRSVRRSFPTCRHSRRPVPRLRRAAAVGARRGTPRPIIEKLNQALNAALGADDVRRRLAVEGADPQPGTPEDYAAIIDREVTMWSNLVKTVGIKPE